MKLSNVSFFGFLYFLTSFSSAQSSYLEVLTQGNPTQLRGISIAGDASIWVSGSNGYFGRSIDNGNNWEFKVIPGFEKAEFRDIHAFDSLTAIVMSSVQPAAILKTIDGGKKWKVCFVTDDQKIFLDGFDFWDAKRGICVGDPINNIFYLLETTNGGDNWSLINDVTMPEFAKGTAAFAASGNGIQCLQGAKVLFVTGGSSALLFTSNDFGKTWSTESTPMASGFASSGIFALDVLDDVSVCIVGGDYTQESKTQNNFFYKSKKIKIWTAATTPPSGYRSCIKFIGNKKIISCGPNGVDIANTESYRFRSVSNDTYHTIAFHPQSNRVYLAGSNGKVALLKY